MKALILLAEFLLLTLKFSLLADRPNSQHNSLLINIDSDNFEIFKKTFTAIAIAVRQCQSWFALLFASCQLLVLRYDYLDTISFRPEVLTSYR